jgi:hypothetical protein
MLQNKAQILENRPAETAAKNEGTAYLKRFLLEPKARIELATYSLRVTITDASAPLFVGLCARFLLRWGSCGEVRKDIWPVFHVLSVFTVLANLVEKRIQRSPVAI